MKPETAPQTYDVTKYERPSVTVDVVIFSILDDMLKVMLIKRRGWPFEGMWAIPGGFVSIDESLETAAYRELAEETGVTKADVYIEQLFTGKLDPDEHPYFGLISGFRVSAHCLVRRNGDIIQFVPFDCRAWHAGVSQFAGRDKCNDYSIGIELEGTDTLPYTQAQYDVLTELTRVLIDRYPDINPLRITGHEFIAPGRKTDPGLAFDWRMFKTALLKK